MKNTNAITLSKIAYINRHSKSYFFRKGYEDYIKNRPFDYSIDNKADFIRYERGRCFAIFTLTQKLPKASWRNNVMSKAAGERFITSTINGYSI